MVEARWPNSRTGALEPWAQKWRSDAGTFIRTRTRGSTGREDRAEVEGGAEQRHRDLEQRPGAEADAGPPPLARLPGRPDCHPEQDRQHQTVEVGVAERPLLQRLQEPGGERDAEAERDAGHKAVLRAPARRLVGARRPLHDLS